MLNFWVLILNSTLFLFSSSFWCSDFLLATLFTITIRLYTNFLFLFTRWSLSFAFFPIRSLLWGWSLGFALFLLLLLFLLWFINNGFCDYFNIILSSNCSSNPRTFNFFLFLFFFSRFLLLFIVIIFIILTRLIFWFRFI